MQTARIILTHNDARVVALDSGSILYRTDLHGDFVNRCRRAMVKRNYKPSFAEVYLIPDRLAIHIKEAIQC